MSALSVNHLLDIRSLTKADIELILQTAGQFKEVINRPIKKVPSLRDVTIANVFFEDSTRTRLSFELAQKRLSADVVNFSSSNSSVKKGETLLDTVRNILAMKVDMVVMRHSSSGAPHFLSQHTPAIIVNAGDGIHAHPTQALLDVYTIQERLGSLQGRRVAIIGDIQHSRVARSNIQLLGKMGARVRVCGPPTMMPDFIEQFGIEKVDYKLREALEWCEVAMVLRIQLERHGDRYISSLEEYRRHYGVTLPLLEAVSHPITVMHPGPINRGVELTSEAADSEKHSVILDQVENGVAVRMAVMYLLFNKRAEAGS